jgi:hypothetical protein
VRRCLENFPAFAASGLYLIYDSISHVSFFMRARVIIGSCPGWWCAGVVGIKLDRTSRMVFGHFRYFTYWQNATRRKAPPIIIGEHRMRACERWIKFRRPLKEIKRLLVVRSSGLPGMPKATLAGFSRSKVPRWFAQCAPQFRIGDSRIDGCRQRLSDFILDCKHILKSAIIPVRPNVVSGLCIY